MSEQAIDPRRFRDVLGSFPTGVVIIGAIADDGEPVGMVVGSFTSLSLDPPLVAFMPAVRSKSYARLRESSRFCVSVLSAEQEQVCRHFASAEADKFAGQAWAPAPSGSPRLLDAVAWIDCEVRDVHRAGDHDIVIGGVTALDVGAGASPLLFFRGGYGGFDPRALAAPYRPDLRTQLRVADVARPHLERLAATTGLQSYTQAVVADDLVITAACGRSDLVGMHVGRRLPLAPPFGALFAASDAGQARRWRENGGSEEVLDRVRERGWSIGLLADRHDDAWDDIRAFGDGAESPEAARRAAEARLRLIPSYDPPSVASPDGVSDVRIITAPVREGSGAVVSSVALFGLPPAADRDTVHQWIAEAVRTADAVSADLARGSTDAVA